MIKKLRGGNRSQIIKDIKFFKNVFLWTPVMALPFGLIITWHQLPSKPTEEESFKRFYEQVEKIKRKHREESARPEQTFRESEFPLPPLPPPKERGSGFKELREELSSPEYRLFFKTTLVVFYFLAAGIGIHLIWHLLRWFLARSEKAVARGKYHEQVINHYGKVLEETSQEGMYFDTSFLLPYSKQEIENILKIECARTEDEKWREHFKTGLIWLSYFQESVGEEPLKPLPHLDLVSYNLQRDALRDDPDAMLELANQISKNFPDREKWERIGRKVKAEAEEIMLWIKKMEGA